MLLKNTAKFRQTWKTEQGYDMPHWDENFIGAAHDETSGFYKMVNGIVNNIKADLTPKLQNAQDAQAIYEFLQNAADSQATDCAILYDEHFFLALNNGKPFSEADIKAVLNSFQGTKADKTKPENCGKIGRYGIGFKLVHRLVGKFDGADELLNDLAGPILFSWAKKQQLDDLIKAETNTKIDFSTDFGDNSPASWLIKIVLSCFPVAPEEKIKDLQYQSNIIFKQEEVLQLADFLRRHAHLLQNLNLERGSIIFLKFGEKKYEKLKDSLLNLKSGIGYSLNLLKTLKRVVLIDEVIERFPIQMQHFTIPTDSPDFKTISPEFPFCPIEITVGYETAQTGISRMKESPSFYQYFPMRNERHNLAFFVHATSFNKVTDRTHLDDQGEANFATFQYLCQALQNIFANHKSTRFEQFTILYKAFLLSDKPNKYNSQLIGKYLYEPMLNYIRANIPTSKKNTFAKDLVIVKQTQLPAEPMNFGIAKEWFFWTDESDNYIKQEASKPEKLGLASWSLRNILLEGQSHLINEWFATLSAQDYEIFVEELRQISFDREFLNKFTTLKAFRCLDNQGKIAFFSLEELKNQQEVFLVNPKTKEIAAELKKMSFLVLEINIAAFKELQNALRGKLDYLFDNKALYQKIVAKITQTTFNTEEKHRLFSFLSSLKEIPATQLQEIILFQNQKQELTPLKNLLPTHLEVEPFLEDYKIIAEEYAENLTPYLLKKEDVYTQIIYPSWEKIIAQLPNPLPLEEAISFVEIIKTYYKTKKGRNLQEKAFVYALSSANFEGINDIFYDNRLANVENYEQLHQAFFKLAALSLPHKDFLKILLDEPFKTNNSKQGSNWVKVIEKMIQNAPQNTLTADEKFEIFKFLRQIGESAITEKIAIFTNELNEKQLPKNLIPPDAEIPQWLAGFKIRANEFKEELRPYLCRKEDIYQNAIAPLWDNLVAQNNLLKAENITEFYTTVRDLFSQNRNNKPLQNKKHIFISKQDGFDVATKVFFNKASLQVRNYGALQKAIQKVSNLKLPDKNIYDFLAEIPFKTEEISFIKSIKNDKIVLAEDEAFSLIQLGEQTNEFLFQHFILEETETEKEYLLSKKGNFSQAFAGKGKYKIHEAIQTYFPEKYKILPEKLFVQSFENKGLVGETTLAQELLKIASTEDLADMLAESTNAVLLEQTLSRFDEIIFRQGVLYDKNSPEYQAIILFKQKEAKIENIMPKLFFETAQGDKIAFAELLYEQEVIFSIEKLGKYTLLLDKILPNYQDYNAYLEVLSQQFIEIDATQLFKKLQGFLGEKDKKQILLTLINQYPCLENATQLAFVVLESRLMQNKISDFSLYTQAGEQLFTAPVYYLNAPDFVAQNAILDAKYTEISEILRLNDEKRTSFEFVGSEIRLEPYLDKQLFKAYPFAEELMENTSLQAFCLDYLYQKWFEKPTENIEFEGVNTLKDVLGFNPAEVVEDSSLALPDEEMPTWLNDWQQQDYEAKSAFLLAIGVQTVQSDSLKIRQYFLHNEGEITLKQLRDAHLQDKSFVPKMAFWLKKNGITFKANEEKLGWLKKLYNLLENFNPELPLPYIYKTDEKDTPIYTIANSEGFEYYNLEERKIELIREKYHSSIAKLLLILEKKQIRLCQIDLKMLPNKWLSMEESLDKRKLLDKSYEWAEPYYEQWKNEYGYVVFLYQGEFPYNLLLNSEAIHHFTKGNTLIEDKQIFMNSLLGNIEENLFGLVPQNLMLQLLRIKNIQQSAGEIPKTKKENARLVTHQLEVLKQTLSLDNQYDVSNFEPETTEKAIIHTVQKNETDMIIVLKELQNGKLKFNKTELKALANPQNELWIWENETTYRTTLEEALQTNKETELQLDLKELGTDIWRKLADWL